MFLIFMKLLCALTLNLLEEFKNNSILYSLGQLKDDSKMTELSYIRTLSFVRHAVMSNPLLKSMINPPSLHFLEAGVGQ